MTQTSTFQPTLLQKLLGRNYKWWYLLLNSFKARTTYQIDNVLFAVGHVMLLVGTILTWFVASKANLNDFDFREKLTYFLFGTFFASTINLWPSFYGFNIKKGTHTADILYPQSLFKKVWASFYGMALYQNLVIQIIIILFSPIWIKYVNLPNEANNIVFLVLLLPISHLILFFFEIMVGFVAFFITEINGLNLNFGFLRQLFSGAMFPLSLLIPNFWINICNPFAYLFFHPMQIYLGKYTPLETLYVFLGGIAWCVVLYFLAKLVFKMGLKRNESVGL